MRNQHQPPPQVDRETAHLEEILHQEVAILLQATVPHHQEVVHPDQQEVDPAVQEVPHLVHQMALKLVRNILTMVRCTIQGLQEVVTF